MRTPWVVFAAFFVGAAAGAATALLLRTDPLPPPPAPIAVPEPRAPVLAPVEPVTEATAPEYHPLPAPAAEEAPPEAARPRQFFLVGKGGVTGWRGARANLLLDSLLRGGRIDTTVKELPSDAEVEASLRSILLDPRGAEAAGSSADLFSLVSRLVSSGRDTGGLAEEFLRSGDADLRRAGVNLAQGDPPRVDLLLAASSDPDPSVRQSALQGLAGFADDGRVPAKDLERVVWAALRDPDSDVRAAAMALLRHVGAAGAAEAVRILRAGAHREIGAEACPLVEAALAGAPAALLADPLPPHVAEDVCKGLANLPEKRPDLVRALGPQASALLAALPPGAKEAAECLLDAFGEVGETGVLRQVVADFGLGTRIRAEAADSLSHRSPPREWQSAVASWLLDSRVDPQVRRQFVAEHATCFTPSEADGDAAYEAWLRVLGTVARGADDTALAAAAAQALEDNERR